MKTETLFLTAVAMIASCSPLSRTTVSTTVCKLSKDPDGFIHYKVRASGYVDSDGMEWVVLRDDACPEESVSLEYSSAGAASSAAKEITKAIFHTLPIGTDTKDIRATFVGQFEWRMINSKRAKTLVADRIEDLSIKKMKQKRLSPFPELR